MTQENAPRHAATVILTRDRAQGGMEVFLMRRHRDQAFMGGAFVFPGGSVDAHDADPELAASIVGPTSAQAVDCLQEPSLSGDMALGLYVAAVRETFEEAGILLAYDESGRLLRFGDPGLCARFVDARRDIHEGKLTLKALARREQIRLALDLLTPYAHWITPAFEKKRFNTRFFIAGIPAGQVPLHDSIEMTESVWMSPREALAAYRDRKILLMPPTLKNLEELSRFDSMTALVEAANRRKILPIMPQACKIGSMPGLLLPHDPDYPLAEYKQPPRPEDPSRIVFREKMWRTEMADSGTPEFI